MYDTCKTGRTRQAAGAGKHPPEAAARGNKPLRFLPDVIHGTCRGGGRTYSAGTDRRMGRVRHEAAAGGRRRLCAGGRRLLCRGGGDHRAVHSAQKQEKSEKRRDKQARRIRTGGEKPMKKRILSILLVCCMVLTLLPATAFAAEVETGARASNPGGLCEHHPEHDEACGYTEGTAEIPCSHEHTEECHSLITRCVHAHTAECYTAESVSENADGLSEAENAAPTECVHACTEESGCILQTSDCKHAHDKDCGYAPASMGKPCTYLCEICDSKDGKTPMPLLGAARPAATQYTYTLHYDANGGSGAPPSQSETSSELSVWIPISEKIPTRDGYTFKGWADSPNENPRYLREEGYYWNYLMVHPSLNETIYAIWEVHNHNWGEWISNGNGTHTRTCITDSSHTETGNCSGGKATSTEKAICETCHTAYGELLQLTKTVITTPPTLPSEGYVGDQYLDGDLEGGEAKVEGTDIVVPGSFRFKHNWGGVVDPGENRMEILFTPDDTETYATAECIVTVTGIKHTITSVIEKVINNMPLGTTFEDLWLPFDVDVKTNTGDIFYSIPVTWDGSSYDPNKYGEQIITGQLDVEGSFYEDELEPTSTVKAIARITLIGDEPIVPTLDPPTYSRQIYSGDFCQLAFSDEYLSGGKATADGETVPGVFTLNEEQELYGYWWRDGGLVQVGPLALKVTFTPDDLQKYTTAECTVNVDVIPRKFRQANTSYIDNKKIGTAFEDLGLPNAFYFFAEADEPNHEGSGLNGNVPGIIKWDDSNYDPNSYEEQTIYGEVNRAEFEKYYIVPEGADLRGVIKVTLQADPAETEITQPPVFRWRNGDFAQPDNTMFVDRSFQMGATGGETADLVDGMAKVKGTDTVVPGTFSFKEGTPRWFDELGENVVTVVFTPTDQHGYRTAETTIKVNVIKNTFKRCEEPDPITEKKLGTTFAGLNLPEIVVVEAIDGLRVGMEVSWEESSYDAQSTAWQTIPGTLVFDANDEHKYQQPEPAVTAAIRVKLLGPEDAPAITTTTLPGGTVGSPYHHQLQATGGGFILWELFSGELPDGLTLKQTTGEISGTPTAEQTAQFTVRALNSVGNDKKELSITITNVPAAEHTITVTTAGGGTASASSTSATAGTEITLTATPNTGYHFKEWQVESLAGLVITNNKFTMPDSNVAINAIFEEDSPFAPTKHTVTVKTDGNGIAFASPLLAVAGTEITLTAMPKKGYHFKEWQVISGGVAIENNKFLMPDSNVEVNAVFEKDAPPAPTDPGKPSISVTGAYTYNGSEHTATVSGYNPATMDIAGNTATDAGDYTVRVTSKTGRWADGSTGAVTAAWSIGKATQEAPNGLIGVAPTTEGGSDGKITGVDATMEYRAESETIYTTCTGIEIENLPAGNYFVRYAEDHNHFASPDAEVTVGEGTPLADCTITFNASGGSGSMDSVTVNAGTIYILPACGFTAPADQEFKAWEIGGTEYKVGDSYTVLVDTEIKALWENSVITPTTYTVTVSNDGNGTASASHAKAAAGTEIPLTATPNTGYHFKEWQVINGGVTIKDDKFLMPDTNVEIKAIFEEDAPPAPTEFTITVKTDENGTASASHAKAAAGTEITLTATPQIGYHFKEWQVMSGGMTIKDNKFIMPDTNVEIKAIFEEDAPPAPTEFIVTFDGNGGTPSVGSMTTTDRKLTSLPSASRSGSYSFYGWYTEKSGGTKITTDTVFHANATVYAHWTYTGGGGGGYNPPVTYYTLRFETGGGSDIPSVQGTYNTYIDLTKYVPTWRGHAFIGWYSERSLTNKVSGVYLTKDMTVYAGWRVDENPGTDVNPFTDISEKDWFYGDVMFVYENGLMLGTSKTLFSPHGTAMRGMMATILWRMEGSPVPKGKNSFTDVEAGKWYADAITWTAENGIFAGYGKDKFGPDDPITREQLAAIFYRYADYKGYDLTVKGDLDKFKDADKITDYAKTAMQWAVGSGLVKRKSGNLLDPQGTATRAEIAAMLHRFIEKYKLVQGKAPGGLMGWIDPKRLQIPKTGDSSV